MGGMDAAWLPDMEFCVCKTPEAKTPWMAFLRRAMRLQRKYFLRSTKIGAESAVPAVYGGHAPVFCRVILRRFLC
jgi:hypothetical protein